MGALTRIGQALGLIARAEKRVTSESHWLRGTVTTADMTRSVFSQNRTLNELSQRCVSYVFICASLNATYCESVPVRLYRRARSKSKRLGRVRKSWLLSRGVGAKAAHWADRADEIEEVRDHPALELLRDPNGDDTGVEYRRSLFMAKWVLGNAFEQFIDGKLPSLRLMQPQFVQVLPDDTGERLIRGYAYGRDTARIVTFEPDEVIQHKHIPSPFDPYYGVGPLHAIAAEADILSAATVWELNRINNGQRPDFVIRVAPGTDEKVVENIKAWWRNAFRGPSKSGEPFVMEADPNIKDIGPAPIPFANDRDLQYQESMQRMERTIRDAYGVGDMLGVQSDASIQIGGSSRDAQESRYMRQTIMPSVVAACETWTERLLPLLGETAGELWFAPDNPDTEDLEKQSRTLKAYTDSGILTIDDALQELGREPTEDGSGAVRRYNGVPLDRVGMVGVDQFGMRGQADGLGKQDGGSGRPDGQGGGDDAGGNDDKKRREGHQCGPDCGHGDDGREQRHEHDAKGKAGGGHVFSVKAWVLGSGTGYDTKNTTPPGDAERAFAEAAQSWLNRLDPTATGTLLNFNAENAAELFRSAATDAVGRMFMAGFVDTSKEYAPQSVAVANTAASRYLRDHVVALSRAVSETVRERLQAAIIEHVERGLPPSETARAVREAMGDIRLYAADRIARTESADAYTAGSIAAARESGVVAGKKWLASANACPICKALESMFPDPVPLDSPFVEKGGTVYAGGRAVTFNYKSVQGPAAHPNCTCTLLYVLKD